MWSKNNISFDHKLKVYEAQVVSIMLYNCDSWAAPNCVLEHLDVTHSNHVILSDMIGVKLPAGHYISNDKLDKCFQTRKLSLRVYRARWRMLGHVLRFKDDTAAYLAYKFCILTEENNTLYRRDAPSKNLLNTFRKDLEVIINDLGPAHTTPVGDGPHGPSLGPPPKHTALPLGVDLARPRIFKIRASIPREFPRQLAGALNTLRA